MSKYIKKIVTAIWALLLVTMFALLAAFGVTQIPAAQRFAARKVAAGMADALGVPVGIERLRFIPFSTLEVAGVVISDPDSLPMISARRVKADVSLFSLIGGSLSLREVQADSAFLLVARKPDGGFNVAALASADGREADASPADFSVRRIKAQRCEVRYADGSSAPVVIEDMSLDASQLRMDEAGCGCSITDFSFFYPSLNAHFALGGDFSLRADTVSVCSVRLSFGDCAANVDTAVAVIDSAGLQMAFVDIPKASLGAGTASRAFGRPVPSAAMSLRASFESDKLNVNHLRLSVGESSSLAAHGVAKARRAGDGSLRFERANLSITGWLSLADIKVLADPDGAWPSLPALPFDCSLTATATDASAGFNVNSESGKMRLYANASSPDGWHTSDFNVQFDADLAPRAPLCGPLARLVSHVAASGRLGRPDDDAGFLRYATVNGGVERIDIGCLSFGGVRFDGVADSHGFDGSVKVDDHLGRLTLIAESQWSGVSPFVAVTARADSVRLGKLAPGLVSPDRLLGFKGRVETVGTDLRTSTTSLLISDLYLNSDTDQVTVGILTADLGSAADGLRRLSLESDVARVKASGDFDLAGIGRELRAQASLVMPTLFSASDRRAPSRHAGQHADFEAQLFGIGRLVRAFAPQLHLPDTVSFRGRVDSRGNMSWAQAQTRRLEYSGFSCGRLCASVVGNAGRANLSLQADGVKLPFLGSMPDLRVDAAAEHDKVTSDIQWSSVAKAGDAQGLLSMDAMVARGTDGRKVWHLGVDRSSLPLADGSWAVDSCRMSIADDRIDVSNFRAFSGAHSVHAYGAASASPADTMWVGLDNIVLEDIIHTDASSKFSLAGDLSLRMAASALLGSPSFTVQAGIDRFFVDGDNLEHLDAAADFQAMSDTLSLDLSIVTGGRARAVANGYYSLKSDELLIPFKIDSLSAGFLNFYLDNCIDGWRGTTSGALSLFGPASDLKLVAELKMNDDNSFRVKQTDVTYYIKDNDSLSLSPSSMDFHNIRFADANGSKGVFYGSIRHNMFSDLDIDLGFDVNDMSLLKTNSAESPTYYGDISGSGRMFVRGRTSNVNVFIDARTGKASSFTVAPNAKSDLSNADFIHFDSEPVIAGNPADLFGTGTTATLKLHITPDAKLSVVIEPKTGNQLSGRGSGDITVEVERTGALAMHGSYAIEEGTYNFAFSVFDKQFTIDKGSSIYWDGGPYDATVNIAATYLVKASIYSLVSGTSYDNNADLKRRVPVKCKIFLSGKLTQPDVRFGIEIPSSQNFNQYAFDQYVNTQEEVSRQVFALLTSGQFYALQESGQQNGQSQNYLGQTASELLSNKLSSMFSNNDRNIGIGVNYRPGDDVSNEEYEVAISTQAFDNKVLLSGNIGYGRDASGSSSDDGTLIGDFDVEVKLNKRGNIRAKAYTHSNNDVIYETSPTTQGVGVSFQEEFDSFRELFRSYWRRLFHRRHPNASDSSTPVVPPAEALPPSEDAQ